MNAMRLCVICFVRFRPKNDQLEQRLGLINVDLDQRRRVIVRKAPLTKWGVASLSAYIQIKPMRYFYTSPVSITLLATFGCRKIAGKCRNRHSNIVGRRDNDEHKQRFKQR